MATEYSFSKFIRGLALGGSYALNQYTSFWNLSPAYDADGNLLSCGGWSYTWDGENMYGAFGELLSSTGIALPHRFSTKYYDAETGLYYYGYRFYSPELKRWLNRDPFGILFTQNEYNIVGNSPLGIIDELGLNPEKDEPFCDDWELIMDRNFNITENAERHAAIIDGVSPDLLYIFEAITGFNAKHKASAMSRILAMSGDLEIWGFVAMNASFSFLESMAITATKSVAYGPNVSASVRSFLFDKGITEATSAYIGTLIYEIEKGDAEKANQSLPKIRSSMAKLRASIVGLSYAQVYFNRAKHNNTLFRLRCPCSYKRNKHYQDILTTWEKTLEEMKENVTNAQENLRKVLGLNRWPAILDDPNETTIVWSKLK